ncbi:MAG: UDP-N-acetylmuramate--L-alanine ligase [Candidatus Eremiobacteraeota bacterium]|nr:UDP-N-acetylmuramate--L-alanine ligase [Candidatus Eremiobacteraeota bacterium]
MIYHFVGIGGIGMSAIARVLRARGETVYGSDLQETPLTAALRREGIPVAIGHASRNVGEVDAVVVSSAIARRNPEYVAATRRNIPILHRGEMLARLLRDRRGIAVCGTHGKTTTTAMVHAVLRRCGIDAGLVLGGIDGSLQRNAHDGRAPWFVTEADESDGSFALLEPEIAVVTNLENDHLSSNEELAGLARAFGEFLGKLPSNGLAAIGVDNALASSLTAHELQARVVTFGVASSAAVRAADATFADFGSRFGVVVGNSRLGEVRLRVPGLMNVQNALAAVAVAHHLGLPFAAVGEALAEFTNVRRRFDILVAERPLTLVDDYAHHPTAIAATIAAARQYHAGELVVAFQPHRYTRTAFLAEEFAGALAGADRVYLTPIYAASEPAIPGVSERSIGEKLSSLGTPVRYVNGSDELQRAILDERRPGVMVLMLGAGDIGDVATRLAARLRAPVTASA